MTTNDVRFEVYRSLVEDGRSPQPTEISVRLQLSVEEVARALRELAENTTPAAAVAALFGMRAEDWTGRGTGVDDETYAHKIALVEQARRRVDGDGPLEILRRAGGSELAAIAGATYEARLRSTPVILDGFVVTASVAPLAAAVEGALAHCIAGHCSTEPGHRLLLDKLALEPLLDLDLRLGEGSGALAAVPLVKVAAACVTDVATFSEWGIR